MLKKKDHDFVSQDCTDLCYDTLQQGCVLGCEDTFLDGGFSLKVVSKLTSILNKKVDYLASMANCHRASQAEIY